MKKQKPIPQVDEVKDPNFTKKGQPRKVMGRPKVQIDPEQIKKLSSMGCTQDEMADFFECAKDTLIVNYPEELRIGKSLGKVSVRRMIWSLGRKGNQTSLRYLIHNILKEKIDDPTIILRDSDANAVAARNELVVMISNLIKNNDTPTDT